MFLYLNPRTHVNQERGQLRMNTNEQFINANNRLDYVDFGFLFELGFNLGIASFLPDGLLKNNIKNHLRDPFYYRAEVYNKFSCNLEENEIAQKNVDYLLFKGILSGQNFFSEWIESKTNGADYEIIYFQANFKTALDQNNRDGNEEYFLHMLTSQLDIEINEAEKKQLFDKGNVLHADTIIIISSKGQYHLCVVDNSIALNNIKNYSDIDNIKRLYNDAIFNQRRKNSFNNLTIDAVHISDLNIVSPLYMYIMGLVSKDKPLFKMIQAGSYAYSFIKLMAEKTSMIQNLKSICIVGYTDSEICSCNLTTDFSYMDILGVCFKNYSQGNSDSQFQTLDEKNANIFKKVKSNFRKLFNLDAQTVSDIIDFKTTTFSEYFEDFQNTATEFVFNNQQDSFRNIHAKQIKKYISDKNMQILFLTGNPGIGKTTAIVEHLKKEPGYLFLYLSPRVHVNQDIREKFSVHEHLYTDDAIFLNSSSHESNIIEFFTKDEAKYTNIKGNIIFQPVNQNTSQYKSHIKFRNVNNTTFSQVAQPKLGVLNKLTKAIDHIIQNKLSNKIIATACIQSLRTLGTESTARHIQNIFMSFYDPNARQIKNFDNFANEFPNVIIMIDEITGDNAGPALFHEMFTTLYRKIFNKLSEAQKQKVNFKIIVADASLLNIDVIEKHLRSKKCDNRKIYFKKSTVPTKSFEVDKFKFKDKYNSVCINTNSYPASRLNISYYVSIHTSQVCELKNMSTYKDYELLDNRMATEAVNIICNNQAEQVIVYIQSIKRLSTLVETIKAKYFAKTNQQLIQNQDYLLINSQLSKQDRNRILKVKDSVKFVLTTSSASRGISFLKATYILIDISNFHLETNLMEILQVIYRGRGSNLDFGEKHLKLFVNHHIFYVDELTTLRRNNILIDIFTLLITVKFSILTRIYGSAYFNNSYISIVPVGEKSICSNSNSLIEGFSNLSQQLNFALNRNSDDRGIHFMQKHLIDIFSSMNISLKNKIYNKSSPDEMQKDFHECWDKGLDKLLAFKPLADPIILGDLMIFHIRDGLHSSLNFNYEQLKKTILEKKFIKRALGYIFKSETLTDDTKQSLSKALNTIEHAFKSNQSQSLVEELLSDDIYVAVPILGLFSFSEFETFKEPVPISAFRDSSFKYLLKSLLNSYYSVENVLPISADYENIPFVVFRCTDLKKIRAKMYNDKYMFCSREINLLNLLLIE